MCGEEKWRPVCLYGWLAENICFFFTTPSSTRNTESLRCDCSSKASACPNKDRKKQNISTLNHWNILRFTTQQCSNDIKSVQVTQYSNLKPWAHHSDIQRHARTETAGNKIRLVQWIKRLRFKYRTFLFPFRVNSVENLK